MGLVEVGENCHPQDLSFLSVIARVSNFIHPVARRLSPSLAHRRAETGSGLPRPATSDIGERDILRAREAEDASETEIRRAEESESVGASSWEFAGLEIA